MVFANDPFDNAGGADALMTPEVASQSEFDTHLNSYLKKYTCDLNNAFKYLFHPESSYQISTQDDLTVLWIVPPPFERWLSPEETVGRMRGKSEQQFRDCASWKSHGIIKQARIVGHRCAYQVQSLSTASKGQRTIHVVDWPDLISIRRSRMVEFFDGSILPDNDMRFTT